MAIASSIFADPFEVDRPVDLLARLAERPPERDAARVGEDLRQEVLLHRLGRRREAQVRVLVGHAVDDVEEVVEGDRLGEVGLVVREEDDVLPRERLQDVDALGLHGVEPAEVDRGEEIPDREDHPAPDEAVEGGLDHGLSLEGAGFVALDRPADEVGRERLSAEPLEHRGDLAAVVGGVVHGVPEDGPEGRGLLLLLQVLPGERRREALRASASRGRPRSARRRRSASARRRRASGPRRRLGRAVASRPSKRSAHARVAPARWTSEARIEGQPPPISRT